MKFVCRGFGSEENGKWNSLVALFTVQVLSAPRTSADHYGPSPSIDGGQNSRFRFRRSVNALPIIINHSSSAWTINNSNGPGCEFKMAVVLEQCALLWCFSPRRIIYLFPDGIHKLQLPSGPLFSFFFSFFFSFSLSFSFEHQTPLSRLLMTIHEYLTRYGHSRLLFSCG